MYIVLSVCVSRTEANDLALLIAETVTGHSEVIVIDGYVRHTNHMIHNE